MKNFYRLLLLLFFLTNSLRSFSQAGSIDPTFRTIGTFNGDIYTSQIQSDGRVLLGGAFSHFKAEQVNYIMRFNEDGSRDLTFNTGSGFDSDVRTIVALPNGKILVGGQFKNYNGKPFNGIVKLNNDGSIDESFTPEVNGFGVIKFIVQSDNKLVLLGVAHKINGQVLDYIVRLNEDGSIDPGFSTGAGANAQAWDVIQQKDGKLVIGGDFTQFNNLTHNRLVRLNTDGSVDPSFVRGSGPDGRISVLALEADERILAGGYFNNFDGTSRSGIVRLNSDGSLNTEFTANATPVDAIAIEKDNRIIIGGQFDRVNTVKKFSLARLNIDGTLDPIFNPDLLFDSRINFSSEEYIYTLSIDLSGNIFAAGAFKYVNKTIQQSVAKLSPEGKLLNFVSSNGLDQEPEITYVQPDKKILFTEISYYYEGIKTARIFRLLPDGAVDPSFKIGTFNSNCTDIGVQNDGKILVSGIFTKFNGVAVNGLVRLNPDGSYDATFNVGSGATNGNIISITIQNDQKILLAGSMTTFNGSLVNRIVRLNPNGSKDESFKSGYGFNNTVNKVVQDRISQRLYAIGYFDSYNGELAKGLVAISPDGSRDRDFDIGTGVFSPESIAIRSDGKVLLGASANIYNGYKFKMLALINTNGTLDTSFNPQFINYYGTDNYSDTYYIKNLAVQPDGKVLYSLERKATNPIIDIAKLARLNPDGSADDSFKRFYSSITVNNIIFQDSYIILSSQFFNFHGVRVFGICRINGYPSGYNMIRGRITGEKEHDCSSDTDEKGIRGVFVKATPGPFYGITDTAGYYRIMVDSGSVQYHISQILPSTGLITQQCPVSPSSVSLSGSDKDTCCFNFYDNIKQCAYITVDIESDRRRRCMRSNTFIQYCNEGNVQGAGLKLTVILPEYVKPISSYPAWTSYTNNTLVYDISNIDPGQCQTIRLIDSVVCDIPSIRGLTQCTKAIISPNNNCETPNSSWDNSSITVKGSCDNGNVKFEIKNVGTGNMADSISYRVYFNDTLGYVQKVKLSALQSTTVSVNGNGSTIRLEADQSPYHPGSSKPVSVIEACGGNLATATRNLVTTRPMDDLDPEVAISCLPILDSYDPNDKNSTPSGLTDHHYISGEERLKYKIRFQNTGSDVAYNIFIIDTLDQNLDFSTFQAGASSHPYTLEVSGKVRPVLNFKFDQIMLPDSTTDLINSVGFVEYSIKPAANISPGGQITNTAGIYFDFNEPVITNTYIHEISQLNYVDFSKAIYVNQDPLVTAITNNIISDVNIYPNPFTADVFVELPNTGESTYVLRIISLTGKEITRMNLTAPLSNVNFQNADSGIYLYELWSSEGVLSRGKLIKK